MKQENQTQLAQAEVVEIAQATSQAEEVFKPLKDLSIIPSIKECERFIQFLNTKFELNLRKDLIILIHETSPRIKGYFRSVKCGKIWIKDEQKINSIVLSSHTLNSTPYETLAHELAHYINFSKGIKDCSNSQYHNKQFKAQAERLLLSVEKINYYGFALTTETDEFKKMLEEFKPNEDAFKIFQDTDTNKKKVGSRLIKYVCGCGEIIRGNQDTKATCRKCETEFIKDGLRATNKLKLVLPKV